MVEKPVTVARFIWLDDAEEAGSLLRGYGIDCSVGHRHLLSWYPHLSVALRGAELIVNESLVPDAMEILQSRLREKLVWCPRCDSPNVVAGRRSGWLVFFLFALGAIPVRPLPRLWRCRNCGFKWKSRHESCGKTHCDKGMGRAD